MAAHAAGWAFALSLMLAAAMPALANPPLTLTDASFLDIQAKVASSKGFPNEEHRLRGLMSYQNGDYGDAAASFERAARYADKFSQHYLSLMHWHGAGVPADPVQGYIWADLAAERGKPELLAVREKMWSQLSPAQQEQAMARGAEDYTRYGDPVAKPRTEAAIRRFKGDMTGSRVGARNMALAMLGAPVGGSFEGPGGMGDSQSETASNVSSAESFYGDERMNVSQYWKAQDRMLGTGRVDVGPVSVDREKDGEPR